MRLIFITSLFLYSVASAKDFSIRIQKNIYAMDSLKNTAYSYYQFLGNYYLDRKKQNIINYDNVLEGINKIYPHEKDFGFLSIDLENSIFKQLKSENPVKRKDAVSKFIQLVDFIKKYRPNVEIGIYGIPFSFNYEFQKNQNYFVEIEPLLKKVDYLSPSLYFSFSEQQQNETSLTAYIYNNLSLFLDYAYRVNKPIYIYVWYIVHPYNKVYGGQKISYQRMKFFISYLKQYQYRGKKVDGIIWWESVNQSKGRQSGMSITSTLLQYTK